MAAKIIEAPEDIRIFGAFQGFFPIFLRKLWKTDKERNWQVYTEEQFSKFWDIRTVEKREKKVRK